MGQGKNDMIVGYGQQFGGTFRQPSLPRCPLALGTVPIQARNGGSPHYVLGLNRFAVYVAHASVDSNS